MRIRIAFIVASLLLAGGCGKSGGGGGEGSAAASQPAAPTPTPAPSTGDPVAKGKEVFAQRCVPCHGSTGNGDGPASASLEPKPRRFGDPEWQASVTDEHITKIIQYGGAAVGKAPTMPGNPDLTDPAVLDAIKNVVRGFRPQ